VRVSDQGYFFTPIGRGDIDCASILRAVAATRLNLSIEMPLRLHRNANSQPQRDAEAVPLVVLETAVKESLAFVERHIAYLD